MKIQPKCTRTVEALARLISLLISSSALRCSHVTVRAPRISITWVALGRRWDTRNLYIGRNIPIGKSPYYCYYAGGRCYSASPTPIPIPRNSRSSASVKCAGSSLPGKSHKHKKKVTQRQYSMHRERERHAKKGAHTRQACIRIAGYYYPPALSGSRGIGSPLLACFTKLVRRLLPIVSQHTTPDMFKYQHISTSSYTSFCGALALMYILLCNVHTIMPSQSTSRKNLYFATL